MDVSMQLRALANAVGEDFAMNAPDDSARLIGRARRGRMVWSTGVGAAVVGSAASLAFGGPALASALSSGPAIEPGATGSATPSATATVSPSPDASATPSETATPSVPPTRSPGAGTIDLTGGAGGSHEGADDSGESDDDLGVVEREREQEHEQEQVQEHEHEQDQQRTEDRDDD